MRVVRLLLLIICVIQAHPDAGEKLYAQARKNYYKIKAARKVSHNQLVDLACEFAHVQDVAPQSYRADDALYMAGTIYLDAYDRFGFEKDLDNARKYLNRLWKLYSSSRYADDALFMLADTYRARTRNLEKALFYYRRIVELYPRGDQVRGARYWLEHLKAKVHTVSVSPLNIRYWSYPRYTRVVIETGDRVVYQYNRLPGGRDATERIYVDLEPAEVKGKAQHCVTVEKGYLKRIRMAQFARSRVRVVLDLSSTPSRYRVFHFESPFRIVVDIFAGTEYTAGDELAALIEGLGKKRKPSSVPSRRKEVPKKPQKKMDSEKLDAVVVIDPGHGGHDPGAIGRYGTKEKDVTLKLALLVKKKLEARGISVVLTRSRDVYVSLEERTAIANSAGADVFISIHANASRNRRVRGVEAYYFEKTSDRDVLRLAASENNVRSIREMSDLQYILFDMVARYKSRFSRVLAEYLHRSTLRKVRQLNRTRDLGAKPGPFYVLKNAVMPSVLIETSFISNPREEKLLNNRQYIDALAQGIAEGIIRYLRERGRISI